jgi:hypothetical protein
MSADTTTHSMYDSDELTWTCECGQVFDLYEPEPSTTIRCQDWQTQSSAPARERDYVQYLLDEYLLVGCLFLAAIYCLVQIYWFIEYLLT